MIYLVTGLALGLFWELLKHTEPTHQSGGYRPNNLLHSPTTWPRHVSPVTRPSGRVVGYRPFSEVDPMPPLTPEVKTPKGDDRIYPGQLHFPGSTGPR